jgi:hypothetical protein
MATIEEKIGTVGSVGKKILEQSNIQGLFFVPVPGKPWSWSAWIKYEGKGMYEPTSAEAYYGNTKDNYLGD